MKIADLFVALGVKGSDKSKKDIAGVGESLKDVKTMSLEAKAAIVGVVYELKRMMEQSMGMGRDLVQFNSLTGLSAQTLQRYEYAARQAGASNEDLMGSVKAVQNAMTNMILGKGSPEGMGMLAKTVGLDKTRVRDTFYMLQKLQEFAQKTPPDVGNQWLRSFGLSDSIIAAMRQNAFTAQNLAKAPVYSEREAQNLKNAYVMWSNLGTQIEMAFGKFNARHGQQLVADIGKITEQIIKLIEAIVIFAEKAKIFEVIGKAAEATVVALKLMGVGIDDFTGKHKEGDNSKTFGKDSKVGAALDWRDRMDKIVLDYFKNITPSDQQLAPIQNNQTPGNMQQNLHFHGPVDGEKVKKGAKDGFQGAMNQMFSRTQVT